MGVSVYPAEKPLSQHHTNTVGASSRESMTEYETIMQLPPNHPVTQSIEQRMALRDIIEDAIQELSPTERWAFNYYVIERLSLRNLAEDAIFEFDREKGYSKTHVARLRDQAKRKLAEKLKDNPLVRAHLHV